jgi:hypothetical protein
MYSLQKNCCTCQELKDLSLFAKDKSKKDGHHSKCKQCKSAHEKNIRLNGGREKDRERLKKWTANNRELKRQMDREYYKKNSDKIKKYVVQFKKTNEIYGAASKIRSLINSTLKQRTYTKKSKTHQILGCDYEFFAFYMEMQFKEGMTWDNHGLWHIDHKKPVSLASNEDEIISLNHYTNLQPLWAFENLSKGKKYHDLTTPV